MFSNGRLAAIGFWITGCGAAASATLGQTPEVALWLGVAIVLGALLDREVRP